MGSYPLLSQAPIPVEVELGCDNKRSPRSYTYDWTSRSLLDIFKQKTSLSLKTGTLSQTPKERKALNKISQKPSKLKRKRLKGLKTCLEKSLD